ncbi:DUF1877 family protein [Acrocarpospora catenulata]|uniref:DUF1877 family protein n=1 Tax=Acrocarpospora catenulata TaxID=2836182 RepID=UPI001BD91693|nr:DUF1877 family protein [Acrocarpospora catenulata]
MTPESLSWVLGYAENPPGNPEPPWADIDKAWEDILRVLDGTGQDAAYTVLDVDVEFGEGPYAGVEIRRYPPDLVRTGATALSALRLAEIRALALERELTDYDGDPIEYLLDYTLSHLETIIRFWREAAESGEGIVSSTS